MFCSVGAYAAERKPRGLARTLWLGASVATLATLATAGQALADVTVNGGNAPVATATASSSGADNIIQSGTLSVDSAPGITLNSSNNVTNNGTIQVQDKDNQTGILSQNSGDLTGTINNAGSINFNSSNTLTTVSNNGIVTGPFSVLNGLLGIHVAGPGALFGDINNTGSINIQGSGSAAIQVDSPLRANGAGATGSITQSGTITVRGTNSFGILTKAAIDGNVAITGAITASGPGAQAVNLGGDVGGAVLIENAISSTGYQQTSRSTDTGQLAEENTGDVLQGGSTLTVGGSVAKGILVSAPPIALSSTNTDANGDLITDTAEPTGSVNSFGSAPAIKILPAAGVNATIGTVGTGPSAFGVVIEGTVAGQGLRDGVSSMGLQVGPNAAAGETGGTVKIPSGISVTGTLTATSYGVANATGLYVGAGATVPVLYNGNQLTATVTGESANIVSRAIQVDAGGSLPTILNAGTITGAIVGSSGTAVAIQDTAGSLTHLENTGTITGLVTPASGSTIPLSNNTAIAIDDHNNTTGLTLINYQGVDFTSAPTISGSILMGAGNDTIDMRAGSITGDLSFGGGANTLRMIGGAITGAVTTSNGGTLDLSIDNATLTNTSAAQLNLTSLTLGAKSALILTVDPRVSTTLLNVSGAANVASGAKIGVQVGSLFSGTQTFDLIHTNPGQLSVGAVDTSLLGNTPYIYAATLSNTASDMTLTIARKTAAQLDLPGSLAGGYEPVVAAVAGNPVLSQALLLPTTRSSFIASYNQLLPEHSGGLFEIVRAGVEAFGRPLDDRQAPEGGGVWLQEVNVGAFADDKNGLPGYKAWGVGLIAGFESHTTPLGIFGLTVGGFSGELRPHDSDANDHAIANLIEGGGYWRATVGRFAFNARLGADYLMASDNRVVDISNNGQTLYSATATGNWNGWGLTSRVRASYEADWKSLYVRPQVGIDFLRLSEGAYTEHGGGDIDLAVDSRTTSQLSGFAGVAFGALFGQQGGSWGPELLLGYRDVVNNNDGLTTARFLSGGDAFTVGPNPISGSGGVARLALKSESAWGAVSLEGGAEARDGLTVYDAKLAVHLMF
jgi:hypothetical protein